MTEQKKLTRLKALYGYGLGARDGDIGSCRDFLFDDEQWGVRYIVADTRKWLPGRKVLISPIAIGTIDVMSKTLDVDLTKDQIEAAPPLDADAPVSRQYERFYNRHFDWADYWGGTMAWGPHVYPRLLQDKKQHAEKAQAVVEKDVNLRSTEEVQGYQIHASDDEIGHIEDFIVDEETWMIRYLVIDTSNWIPGSKRVIISPDWVDSVDWTDRALKVKMTREQIKNSPEYDPTAPVYRDYEKSIFDHYGFPYHW